MQCTEYDQNRIHTMNRRISRRKKTVIECIHLLVMIIIQQHSSIQSIF